MHGREHAGTLAVVALLVLAGCFGGGGPTATPTDGLDSNPERSPTETVTSGTSAPSATTPPGVSGSTLQNITALLAAHEGSLMADGFVAEAQSNGRTFRYAVDSDGDVRSIESDDGNLSVWTNGTVALTRRVSADGRTYARSPETFLSPEGMTRVSRLRALLTSTGYRRAGTTDCGGSECVVLRSGNVTTDRFRNLTAEVHVDPSGVVRTFDAEYVRVDDGSETSVSYVFTVRKVGDVTIERPDWVPEALDELE